MPHATPTEHDEQVSLFRMFGYAQAKYPALGLAHAIPNGGQRHKAVAARLRAEGVRRGVPDIFVPAPVGPFGGLYIELKRRDAPPSAVRPEQRDWHQRLRSAGYAVEVCRGADDAFAVALDYLDGRHVLSA